MSEIRCIGCIDPITKFIELSRNPSILCSDCRRFEGQYSSEIQFSKFRTDSKNEKKVNAKLWAITSKYALKLSKTLSPNLSKVKFSNIKGAGNMNDKLKSIFDGSDKKKEIFKVLRSLYKSTLSGPEKIKYLQNRGGVFTKIGDFFEMLEIALESHLYMERNSKQ